MNACVNGLLEAAAIEKYITKKAVATSEQVGTVPNSAGSPGRPGQITIVSLDKKFDAMNERLDILLSTFEEKD
jgi:hypothetical protein